MIKKTFLIPFAAASVLAAALPAVASAQPMGPINQRQAELDRRIDMGVRNHSLTRAEAGRLRAELRRIDDLQHRYARNGLSRWEVADLDRRMDVLSRQIRWERHDDQRRYGDGYGRDDYRHDYRR